MSKILISGLANTGKTTLLQTLTDVLVIAHDGKKYPFPQPHVNVDNFNSVNELTSLINDKIAAYEAKFGVFPKTIAIDSVSKIFESIAINCGRMYKGFEIWKNVNSEVSEFTSYIEDTLISNGITVVLISHATWDVDTSSYQLVAQGSFAKKGGFLSEVDNAIFVEIKNGKRIIHHRSPKFASRTTLSELPDNQTAEEYNLQIHVDILNTKSDEVSDYIL